MIDLINCPACRGSKLVAKMGSVMGDCLSCNATGKINREDKPEVVEFLSADIFGGVTDLVKQVSNVQDINEFVAHETVVPAEVIEKQRKVFKRNK